MSRMEVMDEAMLKAREAYERARVLLPALFCAVDNHNSSCRLALVDTSTMDLETYTMGLTQFEGGQEEWDRMRDVFEEKRKLLEGIVRPELEKAEASYRGLEQVQGAGAGHRVLQEDHMLCRCRMEKV